MLNKFGDNYDKYLKIFNGYLSNFLNSLENSNIDIVEPIKYSLLNGGKRVRPILALATCDMLNVDFELVKNYCLAIELIHTYSLVHDDLPCMDNDDYRRGKLSTHKKFGEAMGVLTGDALLNLAIEVVMNKANFSDKDVKATKLLFEYSGYKGMIKGQVLDLKNEHNKNIDETTIYEIQLNKTCKLLTAPLLISSILADNLYYENLLEYGTNLGLTFQIIDDILDVESSLDKLGKTPNKDIQEDKLTAVKVYGLNGAKQLAKTYYEKSVKSIKDIKNNSFLIDFATKLYERQH